MRVTTKTQLQSPILQPGTLTGVVEKIVAQTASDYERRVKEKMRAPKSGRTYRRGAITRAASSNLPKGLRTRTTEKGRVRAIVGYRLHRASAPGEAPAVDEGRLINSIVAKPDGLRATVTVGAPHAEILEYKKDRPVFEPTLEEMREPFVYSVDEAVKQLCEG